jgi:hypothetical protein
LVKIALVLVPLLAIFGCLWKHAKMDIPPPGGCDACHRYKISGGWEVAIAPVRLGEAGGIPEDVDIVLRELQQMPYHAEVPTKRLAVYAAAAPPEVVGDEESGIQCFVCHRSPDPPHEKVRGRFHHPWGQGAGDE